MQLCLLVRGQQRDSSEKSPKYSLIMRCLFPAVWNITSDLLNAGKNGSLHLKLKSVTLEFGRSYFRRYTSLEINWGNKEAKICSDMLL